MVPARDFGATGLRVPLLGLGAGQIGDASVSEAEAGRLLNAALDLGVALVDTARAYGLSEERIGRHLAHRRGEYLLVTKVGYGVDGVADWTASCVRRGVDEALRRLRTEVIDVALLHSCGTAELADEGILRALDDARREGKVRVAGYSGENAPLELALELGRFGAIECSVNLCDQRAVEGALPVARERGLGVIAKRPIANAPWRHAERPAGQYVEEYWVRWKAMGIDPAGLPWDELALRFSAYQPGVCSCIVGTARLEHLRRNAEMVARGPLPTDLAQAIRAAFRAHDQGWTGQV
ncbi:MAG TPA: aldo/keto reductase [Anaeromyxobacteraceae bacterium]|nr:aldo/keto reductase [Anaeromyxobacteraceae bacterium]